MAADAGALKEQNEGDETAFMGKPLDFIDKFSPSFTLRPTPIWIRAARRVWPKPERIWGRQTAGKSGKFCRGCESRRSWTEPIETYMVTAYWLRKRMGKVDEAEQFFAKDCAPTPATARFCSSWAGYTRRIAMTTPAPAICGNWV